MPNDHHDRTRGAAPSAVRAAARRRGSRAIPTAGGTRRAPALLAILAGGEPASGPELAKRLGISRAAVWKQVEALRAAGVEIGVEPGQGYRLAHPLELLDPARIRRHLGQAGRRVGKLETRWQLDSTSSEIARRADALPDRSFVFAETQSAGRGRRGRTWLSPPAVNLEFSCLKRFHGGYAALSGLSLAVGIAVLRALEDRGVHGVMLKWPNDLVHGDAKLGGILIELGGEFMGPCHAVIGIGINLRLPRALRAALDRPATDLAALCGGTPPPRNPLAAALVARVNEATEDFDRSGFAAFAEDWNRCDALAGRRLHVDDPRGEFEGVGAGVDARGALRMRVGGALRRVDSAEVTVRPA
jgi:BirA family transcriptional regulator, biotin operon repressor / biotin---[acetyl-CoA-carboxylase] ligase